LPDFEAITQPPAPFYATPRGCIGPQLLATILFDKFGQHQPLNRQSQRFKCEGIDLSVSTLADQVGAGVFAARPIFELIEAYVLTADRLHGDDTKIPILAKGKTDTGRIWTYLGTSGMPIASISQGRTSGPVRILPIPDSRVGCLLARPHLRAP
jgi:transposase